MEQITLLKLKKFSEDDLTKLLAKLTKVNLFFFFISLLEWFFILFFRIWMRMSRVQTHYNCCVLFFFCFQCAVASFTSQKTLREKCTHHKSSKTVQFNLKCIVIFKYIYIYIHIILIFIFINIVFVDSHWLKTKKLLFVFVFFLLLF
jgi:hypothetical protein